MNLALWEMQVALLAGATALSLLLTPAAMSLSRRFGVLDRPGPGKIHGAPTPLLGGVAIFVTFYGVVVACVGIGFAALRWEASWLPPDLAFYLRNLRDTPLMHRFLAILAAGAGMHALGVWDDLRRLSVRTRLVLQTALAAAVVAAGVRPEFFGMPLFVVAPVVVLWIVGITNAMNLLDGADGEAAGVAAIGTGILAVAMARLNQPLLVAYLLVLTGALLGFLRYNFFPARVFLGSGGAMLIGYLLSVSVLEATFMRHPGSRNFLPIGVPLLVLGVPLYDTFGVMLIRILRRRPVTARDTSHLQHRLMGLGMTQKQAVLLIYLLAFAMGVNALVLVDLSVAGGVILLVQVLSVVAMVALLERAAQRVINIRTGVWRQIGDELARSARASREEERRERE